MSDLIEALQQRISSLQAEQEEICRRLAAVRHDQEWSSAPMPALDAEYARLEARENEIIAERSALYDRRDRMFAQLPVNPELLSWFKEPESIAKYRRNAAERGA